MRNRTLIAVAVALGAAACSSGGTHPAAVGGPVPAPKATTAGAEGPVITASLARSVVDRYVPSNNRANAHLDLGLENRNEAGSAAAIDTAAFRLLRLQHVHHWGKSFTYTHVQVLVSPQTTYPADFLMTGRENVAPHARMYTVFEKTAASAPWKAVYFAALTHGTKPVSLEQAAAGKPIVAPAGLAASYVRYLRGRGPAIYAPGPMTSGARRAMRSSVARLKAQGVRLSLTFMPTSYQPVSFSVHGGTLVFFSIYQKATQRIDASLAARGAAYIQDAKRSRLAGFIPPGSYHGTTQMTLMDFGAFVPSHGRVRIFGDYQGLVSAFGSM